MMLEAARIQETPRYSPREEGDAGRIGGEPQLRLTRPPASRQ